MNELEVLRCETAMAKPHVIDLEQVVSRLLRAKRVPELVDLDRQPRLQAEFIGTLILLLSLKDNATELRVDPTSEGHELSYRVEGTDYELVPPPPGVASNLVKHMERWGKPRGPHALLTNAARRLARDTSPSSTTATFKIGERYVDATIEGDRSTRPARLTVKFNAPRSSSISSGAHDLLKQALCVVREQACETPDARDPKASAEGELPDGVP